MDFKTASDRATAPCITLADIAQACEVSDNTIRRARLKQGGDSYRSPPKGWEQVVAKLARARALDLLQLADQLEASSSGSKG